MSPVSGRTKNSGLSAMAKGLDFSKGDVVPDALMNAMLWKVAHGENAIAPAPVRAAFFQGSPVKKDMDQAIFRALRI